MKNVRIKRDSRGEMFTAGSEIQHFVICFTRLNGIFGCCLRVFNKIAVGVADGRR
ncbi:hypothetical protein SV7mr_23130 [Stieleria bergensis]|uniref:Uncharacterized protein n=1 Tax=Stieleria bergensis TaxID=2528025 RepID=A0A517SUM0_9BACT|nr:hypothetical protein SV7mr_23130 [Planctomycetes bacterium SV_7m_r]